MPIGSGVSAQLGIAEEVTYGTPVTPARFYEFVSESIKQEIERVESAGLRAGLVMPRSTRWATGKKTVAGELSFEVATKNFGLWFKHMLGGFAVATPGGGTLTRDHTFTPADLTGRSLTVQVGRPDVGGTVRAFTYHGCKVAEFELTAEVDELLTLGVTILGEDEDTSTALATPSYPTGDALFVFTQGVLQVAGSNQDVKGFSLSGNNGLSDDRYFLGSQLRKNPLEASRREYTGELTAEFESLTAYNRFVNGTEAQLVLTFTAGLIEGAFNYRLVITANVRFDGETPSVEGPDIVAVTLPFKCLNSGAGDATALQIDYRTTDTAA
jgi:hypothetical protein